MERSDGAETERRRRSACQNAEGGLTNLLTLRANPAREGLTKLHGSPAQAFNSALGPERRCPDYCYILKLKQFRISTLDTHHTPLNGETNP